MANPYVTVPAMPPWAQQLWLRQYLAAYNQPRQPSTGELIGSGFAGALTQGLEGVQRNWQLQSQLDQRSLEQLVGESGQMDRLNTQLDWQRQRFGEQIASQQTIEAAKQQAAMREMALKGRASEMLWGGLNTPEITPQAPLQTAREMPPEMYSGEEYAGSRPATTADWATARAMGDGTGMARDTITESPRMDASGGAEPPVLERTTIAREPLTRNRTVKEVLGGMGAYSSMIPGDLIGKAYEMEKARAEKTPSANEQIDALRLDFIKRNERGETTPGELERAYQNKWLERPAQRESRSVVEGFSTAGTLMMIAKAQPGDPILTDPRITAAFGSDPAVAVATARRLLGPATNLQEYEGAIAGSRSLGAELGRQGAPMGVEASNWINPQTYQSAAGTNLSEAGARAAGYVQVDAARKKLLDDAIGIETKARALVPLFDQDLVGPVQGRLNYTLMLAGQAPPGFEDLYNYSTELRAVIQSLRAGAAVGPREEVYVRNIPDYTMPPDLFQSALSQVLFGVQMAKARILNQPVASPAGALPKPGANLAAPVVEEKGPPKEDRLERFERAREELRQNGYAADDDNVTQFLLKNPRF